MEQMQYITTCSVNFRTRKQIPAAYKTDTEEESKKVKVGRPQHERTAAFLEVEKYIEENDDKRITMKDLIDLSASNFPLPVMCQF